MALIEELAPYDELAPDLLSALENDDAKEFMAMVLDLIGWDEMLDV